VELERAQAAQERPAAVLAVLAAREEEPEQARRAPVVVRVLAPLAAALAAPREPVAESLRRGSAPVRAAPASRRVMRKARVALLPLPEKLEWRQAPERRGRVPLERASVPAPASEPAVRPARVARQEELALAARQPSRVAAQPPQEALRKPAERQARQPELARVAVQPPKETARAPAAR